MVKRELARRRHAGIAPFEEAWFIEGSLDEERAFWLRYTLSHDRDGPSCAVWAAVVKGDLVQAARVAHALPAQGASLLTTPSGSLDEGGATGNVGPIAWALSFESAHSHDHLPARLARMGVSGRHYASPGLDLRVSGSLAVGQTSLSLHGAKAVLGHIWGARANTRAWAWAHCSAFERDRELAFEALSAQLSVGGFRLPWATSAVVQVGDHRAAFTRTRGLFTARSHVHARHWSLQIEQDGRVLQARMELPDERRVVRAGVQHANRRRMGILNSPLSTLRLRLADPVVGEVRASSKRCSLELASGASLPSPHFGD